MNCRNDYVYGREKERLMTVITDTTLGQTYLEPCFFHGMFDTCQIPNPEATCLSKG